MMSKLLLYHGSQRIVSKPQFGQGKIYNDYGRGFYCTEDKELAKEWACPAADDGFANSYELADGEKYFSLRTGRMEKAKSMDEIIKKKERSAVSYSARRRTS